MWICPQCRENIEDQFDSCWKCAGAAQPPEPTYDLMYPFVSLASIGLGTFTGYGGDRFGLIGALLGIVVSGLSIWAFLNCPLRHWFAKLLTLLFLIPGLYVGVLTVGSFVTDSLGYNAR